jgi:tRNA(Ile)-lysidine synthase TilS/MesJ
VTGTVTAPVLEDVYFSTLIAHNLKDNLENTYAPFARGAHVLTEIWCKRYDVRIAKIIRPTAADRKRPFRRS